MLVKDVMRTPVVSVAPAAGLDRALMMMQAKRIRHLPVVENDELVGIISDRDLRLSMESVDIRGPGQAPKGMYLPALKKVGEIMTSDVLFLRPEDTVKKAVDLMHTRRIGGLPVLEPESRRVVGMLTETDLLRLLRQLLDKEAD
jgi:acetoin utilization protein AcuB